jgi:hypothetical protein
MLLLPYYPGILSKTGVNPIVGGTVFKKILFGLGSNPDPTGTARAGCENDALYTKVPKFVVSKSTVTVSDVVESILICVKLSPLITLSG